MYGRPQTFMGLSPRVRGNHKHLHHAGRRIGSIPARAGEPLIAAGVIPPGEVYPRACGGTLIRLTRPTSRLGLSPRVRGNLEAGRRHHPCRGSIPARAGEPFCSVVPPPSPGVYPRACGGTCWATSRRTNSRGLSPRVRGNHREIKPMTTIHGSIPARAGEPIRSGGQTREARVYPRACGGTSCNQVLEFP